MAFSFVFISFYFTFSPSCRSTKIPNIRENIVRESTERRFIFIFLNWLAFQVRGRAAIIVIVGVSWKMCSRLFWHVLHILFRIKSSSPLHIRNEWSCIYLAGECERWSYALTLLLLYFVPTSTQMKNAFKMHRTWVLSWLGSGTRIGAI